MTALLLTMIAPVAWAQTQPPVATAITPIAPPPAAPAPGYAPPPPGYALPPPGYAPPGYAPPPAYAPPPGYGYAPSYGYAPAPPRPEYLPYKDGYPIPDGYHLGTKVNKGLIIAGSVTFGSTYLIPVIGAASAPRGEGDVLFIPIVGPFILAGRIDFQRSGELAGLANFAAGTGVVLLVADGLAQAAGAAMLAVGLTREKPALVRDGVAKSTVRVVPLPVASGGVGIGLVGTM